MSEQTPIDPLPGEGPPQAVPPAGGVAPPPPAEPGTAPASDERTMGMLCHLLSFALLLGIPFGNILGPLILWLVKRQESAFVDDQGKESLNFQISFTIYGLVSALLVLVVIGIFLLIALGIAWLVLVILASVKANEGQAFRYPLTIRFIN